MIISSHEKLAVIKILQEELAIEDIIIAFDNVDIIFIEGFKNNNYPKIEVHRRGLDCYKYTRRFLLYKS